MGFEFWMPTFHGEKQCNRLYVLAGWPQSFKHCSCAIFLHHFSGFHTGFVANYTAVSVIQTGY